MNYHDNCIGLEIDVYMESIGDYFSEYLVYFPFFIKAEKAIGFILEKPPIINQKFDMSQ